MSDLISRQDALMEARPEYLNPQQLKLASYNQGWNDAVDDYYDGIKSLPSAEPKTGKWVLKEHLWECDRCGCRINRANPLRGNIWNYNFCPNCGSFNGGEEDDEERDSRTPV